METKDVIETLWANEQILQSESCCAVISWTGRKHLSPTQLKRLQMGSKRSATWHILVRHTDCSKQPSAAGLRLTLQIERCNQLNVHVFKQPNGWGGQHAIISLPPHYERWQRLAKELLPHTNHTVAYSSTATQLINNQFGNARIATRGESVIILSTYLSIDTVH